MPKVNFSNVEDVQNFSPLPDGTYLSKLSEIEEATTQYGDELWKLRFEVIQGEYAGRIIFDNMVFSEAAMKRVKLICSRLGLDVAGELDITPGLLKDRKCYVSVLTEDYEDNEGSIKKRNVVPFAGYELVQATGKGSTKNESEDDLPF